MMQGRIVLVTGASRGIGAATARLLGEHGAYVAVNYNRSEEAAREVVTGAYLPVSGGSLMV
ncbi:MAG: SDR family NAD(P)-dependent oxidoreductase [Acidobacteria bacterium]|nr:SDR family NAD(P)-dependent oxidoreductase [Acidobacteriota bacterium]